MPFHFQNVLFVAFRRDLHVIAKLNNTRNSIPKRAFVRSKSCGNAIPGVFEDNKYNCEATKF